MEDLARLPKESDAKRRVSGITVKSVITSLICVLLLAVVMRNEVLNKPLLGIDEPPLAFLVVVIVFGIALSAIRKSFGFTKAELLFIYVATSCGALYSVISGVIMAVMQAGLLRLSTPKIYEPIYAGLSKWVLPDDMVDIMGFWMGGGEVPWSMWVKVMFLWFIPLFALYLIGICIAVVFRQRWDKEEHLAFPIAQAAYSILSGDYGRDKTVSFQLSRRMFFIGGLISLVLIGPGILNSIWPGIPSISRQFTVADLFEKGTAINSGLQGWPTLYFRLEPISIGLLYLVPLDIAFTAWFFWIVTKLMQVYSFANGVWTEGQEFMIYNPVGAYGALGIYLFYLNKEGIKQFIRSALENKETEDVPMSSRTALVTFFSSLIVLCLFLTFVLHVQIWWSVLYCLMVVFFFTSFFRLRAEAAAGVAAPTHIPDIFKTLFGINAMGTKNLAGLGFLYGRAGVGRVGVSLLEGCRLADQFEARKREITIALVVGFILVYFFTFGTLVPAAHGTADGGWAGASMFRPWYRQIAQQGSERLVTGEVEPSRVAIIASIVGVVVTFFLMFMRTRFLRWPLHPVGYVLGCQYDVGYWLWSSFFLAWVIKLLILRYGGNHLHKIVLPLMYGMIICGMVLQGVQYIVTIAF